MTTVTIDIDAELEEVLQLAARLRGISVDEFLSQKVTEAILDLKERLDHPMIGILDGPEDLSERDEEYLNEWNPD
jgi:hypothetical protein